MARSKERSFGQVIRERRRQLDLTQEETARGIKTSTPYVGHLEAGKRHPTDKTLTRLAEVLGLDRRELFFLANPRALALLSPEIKSTTDSTWDDFRKNEQLRRVHNIASDEMEMLSQVALLGGVPSARDFIYILDTVRHAVGRLEYTAKFLKLPRRETPQSPRYQDNLEGRAEVFIEASDLPDFAASLMKERRQLLAWLNRACDSQHASVSLLRGSET